MSVCEVVVVGAGVGGLSVAVRLAARGYQVTVCEQADTVGGKLGRFERDGFRFDTGPSLLTLPSVLFDTLTASGLTESAVRELLPLRRLDPIARYRFADGTWWDHPADETSLLAACETLSIGSGQQMKSLLRRSEAMWNSSKGPFLESPLSGAGTLVRQAVRVRDLRTIAPHRTLRSLGRSTFADPRLVQFLDRYATYSGSDPRQAPAVLASILWAERSEGAWYLDGGLRGIADVLLHRCVALGIDVRLNTDVVAITTRNGRADGVDLLNGDHLRADVVVANADATHLYTDLVPGTPGKAGLRSVTRSEPSLSGFVLCLAVDRTRRSDHAGKAVNAPQLPPLGHHTVLFPSVYDGEFDALFGDLRRPIEDPAIYLSIPTDRAVAPPGCEAWFVLVNAPGQGDVDWTRPGFAQSEADRILSIMARRGVDVRPHVRFSEIRTPHDLEVRTRAHGGSIYGTSSNGPVAAFLRPKNQSPLPGLFLVGGSAHPGGGLPLVQLSAKIVANLIGTVN